MSASAFRVTRVAPLLGRTLVEADENPGAPPVLVIGHDLWKRRFGSDRGVIGRTVRFGVDDRAVVGDTNEPGPWLEIVGVVKDLGMVSDARGAGLYQPVASGAVVELRVVVGVKGTPRSFAPRLRAVAGEVDPTLQIHELMALRQVGESLWLESQFMSRALVVLSAIALSLSLTAIYSVTAFAVERRRREIGIRVALGADRRRVIGPILRRPLAQVSLGMADEPGSKILTPPGAAGASSTRSRLRRSRIIFACPHFFASALTAGPGSS